MELWDIYDRNRNKTGKTIKRGERLQKDEFHLIVHIWIKNSNNEFLIQQRSEKVKNPLVWCTTGGSAVSGEDSFTAALREAKEELGIDLTNKQGYLFEEGIYEEDNQQYLSDTYLYFIDIDIKDLKLQTEEVKQAKFEKMSKIKEMMANGELFIYDYLDELEKAKLK
jgi:8-oxo-dGTP pyrophosphatase MutT (NUDIX family)